MARGQTRSSLNCQAGSPMVLHILVDKFFAWPQDGNHRMRCCRPGPLTGLPCSLWAVVEAYLLLAQLNRLGGRQAVHSWRGTWTSFCLMAFAAAAIAAELVVQTQTVEPRLSLHHVPVKYTLERMLVWVATKLHEQTRAGNPQPGPSCYRRSCPRSKGPHISVLAAPRCSCPSAAVPWQAIWTQFASATMIDHPVHLRHLPARRRCSVSTHDRALRRLSDPWKPKSKASVGETPYDPRKGRRGPTGTACI
mmetsp:Transcript_25744/g.47042  ORF Transcript_25744/g.47042 Transcript_25744/m.47042 type:complete len:250 (+) Transcript_25744:34-783(+)